MRVRSIIIAGAAALALTGCAGDEPPQVAAAAPPPPQPAISPDIQKILAAGGIDAGAPATTGSVQTATNAVAPGVTRVAAPAAPDKDKRHSRRHRKGEKAEPADLPKAVALADEKPIDVAPATIVPADTSRGLLPDASAYATPRPARPEMSVPPPLPDGPIPALSPLSPPASTVRLPTVAQSPEFIPASAPRQATVTATPVNFNFLDGVGSGAGRTNAPQPVPQQQAYPPQGYGQQPAYPQPYPQQTYGTPPAQQGYYAPQQGAPLLPNSVQGPTPQQVLQPILDPSSLVATPRATRGAARYLRPTRQHARTYEASLPVREPTIAAPPTRPRPAPEPTTPAIRRF